MAPHSEMANVLLICIYLPTFGYSKSGHPMAGGPGGRLGPRRGPGAEPVAGAMGQRPLKLRAFCNFKGQGNTIFILKINVLKVQTGSVAIFPLFLKKSGQQQQQQKQNKIK